MQNSGECLVEKSRSISLFQNQRTTKVNFVCFVTTPFVPPFPLTKEPWLIALSAPPWGVWIGGTISNVFFFFPVEIHTLSPVPRAKAPNLFPEKRPPRCRRVGKASWRMANNSSCDYSPLMTAIVSLRLGAPRGEKEEKIKKRSPAQQLVPTGDNPHTEEGIRLGDFHTVKRHLSQVVRSLIEEYFRAVHSLLRTSYTTLLIHSCRLLGRTYQFPPFRPTQNLFRPSHLDTQLHRCRLRNFGLHK